MKVQQHQSLSNAVYSIQLHIVLVTKYRRRMLTPALRAFLAAAFAKILADWRCALIEFTGEEDHVHLVVDVHPALEISVLINNLKTATARRAGAVFAEHLARFYPDKRAFWHRAYFVASTGAVSLDALRDYVQKQGTTNKPGRRPSRAADLLSLRGGAQAVGGCHN